MNGDCTPPASSEREVLARTHAPRLTQPGSACRGRLRCPTVGGQADNTPLLRVLRWEEAPDPVPGGGGHGHG